jgi:hypothetical protein
LSGRLALSVFTARLGKSDPFDGSRNHEQRDDCRYACRSRSNPQHGHPSGERRLRFCN